MTEISERYLLEKNTSMVQASIDDFDTFLTINEEVQQLHNLNHPDIFKPQLSSLFESDYRNFVKNDSYFLFFIKNKEEYCGYILFEINLRKENLFKYEQKLLYIHQIAVTKSFRGQGIANQVVSCIKKIAIESGISRVELDHWLFNNEAEAFYIKKGFSPFNQKMHMKL